MKPSRTQYAQFLKETDYKEHIFIGSVDQYRYITRQHNTRGVYYIIAKSAKQARDMLKKAIGNGDVTMVNKFDIADKDMLKLKSSGHRIFKCERDHEHNIKNLNLYKVRKENEPFTDKQPLFTMTRSDDTIKIISDER